MPTPRSQRTDPTGTTGRPASTGAAYRPGSVTKQNLSRLTSAVLSSEGCEPAVPISLVTRLSDATLVGFCYGKRRSSFTPGDAVAEAAAEIIAGAGDDVTVLCLTISADRTRAHLGLAAGQEARVWDAPGAGSDPHHRTEVEETRMLDQLATLARPQF